MKGYYDDNMHMLKKKIMKLQTYLVNNQYEELNLIKGTTQNQMACLGKINIIF